MGEIPGVILFFAAVLGPVLLIVLVLGMLDFSTKHVLFARVSGSGWGARARRALRKRWRDGITVGLPPRARQNLNGLIMATAMLGVPVWLGYHAQWTALTLYLTFSWVAPCVPALAARVLYGMRYSFLDDDADRIVGAEGAGLGLFYDE